MKPMHEDDVFLTVDVSIVAAGLMHAWPYGEAGLLFEFKRPFPVAAHCNLRACMA